MPDRKPKSSVKSEKDFLSPERRAEDIILGALGYGEEASIVSIKQDGSGFSGTAQWSDGEEFNFVSDDILSELEQWALGVLKELRPS